MEPNRFTQTKLKVLAKLIRWIGIAIWTTYRSINATTSETIIKIGLEFGNRDHSTVLHSYDKINNEIQNDENNIRQVIEDIKNKIVN